jgi:signal transduction histidine kinase
MIENGNGTIRFESEPNTGTTFTITLPKHEK